MQSFGLYIFIVGINILNLFGFIFNTLRCNLHAIMWYSITLSGVIINITVFLHCIITLIGVIVHWCWMHQGWFNIKCTFSLKLVEYLLIYNICKQCTKSYGVILAHKYEIQLNTLLLIWTWMLHWCNIHVKWSEFVKSIYGA